MWPKSEVSGPWNIGMRSWLLYIPAGVIEIHPQMNYQLATKVLDKTFNLVYGWTYARTDNPNALWPRRTKAMGA